MRLAPTIVFLLMAGPALSLSGCVRNLRSFGPPPPAYACDGYGCDGYNAFGGFSECVDDGQYYSRRDFRRHRRDDRRMGGRGPTYNGLPVVAAYIVPMEMMGDCCGGCGGWECCDSMCGDGFACDSCPPCGACGCEPAGCPTGCGPQGCPHDMNWQSTPSEAYPQSYSPEPYEYDGQMINPVPAPPAQEGPWNPPGTQPSVPMTTPEQGASRPLESATWLPARLP